MTDLQQHQEEKDKTGGEQRQEQKKERRNQARKRKRPYQKREDKGPEAFAYQVSSLPFSPKTVPIWHSFGQILAFSTIQPGTALQAFRCSA